MNVREASTTAAERLARAAKPLDDALRLHALCRGKMQTLPKCPIRGFEDFAVWYSPGVAAPSRAIAADPETVWEHTGLRRVGPRGDRAGVAARAMARNAIVFACANPVPEIWPWEAAEAGARIVATGRGDFPNQLNNSLVFPGLFRGALDVRARSITDGMAIAVAHALAGFAEVGGLRGDHILPRMDEWDVHVRVAVAAAMAAQADGLARLDRTADAIAESAGRVMRAAREATAVLMQARLIPGGEE